MLKKKLFFHLLKCIFFPLGRASITNLFEEGKIVFIEIIFTLDNWGKVAC